MSETNTATVKMRTRCYYTDYVNHAIRFYLSTPDSLLTAGKRKADIDNWIAVQTVFHQLSDKDRNTIITIFSLHHHLSEGVKLYCQQYNANERKTWILVTKTCSAIAKRRGLV